ncbi:hypothetical protein LOD99_5536 [Oopsacas minuta]|uniref:Uncharacterized protein n=1 Tax=Oopsacas minuta TaxID=111878 RepID=A0AAV7JS43_9METZ|nr:hypothetical protein LOD99_5536 [Oopsacas minuta]
MLYGCIPETELKSTGFELIQGITNTLRGFKLITENLSGSYATMGDLFVQVISLLLSLADSDDPIFSGIKSIRLTVRDELKRRMDGLENNDIVLIPTFLDPSFKEKYFSSKYIYEEVRRKVADAVQNLDLEIRNVESNEVVPVSKH